MRQMTQQARAVRRQDCRLSVGRRLNAQAISFAAVRAGLSDARLKVACREERGINDAQSQAPQAS